MFGRSYFAIAILACFFGALRAGETPSVGAHLNDEKSPRNRPHIQLSLGPDDWIPVPVKSTRLGNTPSHAPSELGQDLRLWSIPDETVGRAGSSQASLGPETVGRTGPSKRPNIELSLGPNDWIPVPVKSTRLGNTPSHAPSELGQDLRLWNIPDETVGRAGSSQAFPAALSSGHGEASNAAARSVPQGGSVVPLHRLARDLEGWDLNGPAGSKPGPRFSPKSQFANDVEGHAPRDIPSGVPLHLPPGTHPNKPEEESQVRYANAPAVPFGKAPIDARQIVSSSTLARPEQPVFSAAFTKLRTDLINHLDKIIGASSTLNVENYDREVFNLKARARSIFKLAAQHKHSLELISGDELQAEHLDWALLNSLPDTARSEEIVKAHHHGYLVLKERVNFLEDALRQLVESLLHWGRMPFSSPIV